MSECPSILVIGGTAMIETALDAAFDPRGSISGACGRNAADAICEDLGIDKWWRAAGDE